MDLSNESEAGNRLTWAAALLAILILVPGLFVGQIAAFVYAFVLRFFIGYFPDIVETIVVAWFGQLLAGAVAGALAVTAACHIFKQANRTVVFYSLAIFVVVLTAFGLVAQFGMSQALSLNTVEIIASAVGAISIAYFVAHPESA